MDQPLATPPSLIKSTSRFSPRERECCQCRDTSTGQSQCQDKECCHELCKKCPLLDARGDTVMPHAFPVDWVCSTCGATHSVLDILTKTVDCSCKNPTLQAVYDQFGKIFLFWRNDPDVFDLTDPLKLREAAWRVWRAGGEPWLPDLLEAQKAAKAAPRWSRLSQASISTASSDDAEMSG